MTTPSTQLEVAAHWLKEASIGVKDRAMRENLKRVAEECLAVAKKAANGLST